MRKIIATILVFGSLLNMAACGDASSGSESSDTSQKSEITSTHSEAENSEDTAAVETENVTVQNTLNEDHVEKIMQWVDKSMTTSANNYARIIYNGIKGEAMGDMSESQRKKYDGIYNKNHPFEISIQNIDEYLDDYCFQIEGGEITACWVAVNTWTEEFILSLKGDSEGIELWDDMGFTDYDALHEAVGRLNSLYYGAAPVSTISVYDEPQEEGNRYYLEPEKVYIYSNQQPDINQCKKQ